MARQPQKVGLPIIDRAKVFAAFRQLKGGPLPSKTLIYSILAIANDRSGDGPPFNQFYGDDLHQAYFNLFRLLLRTYRPYWRNTLKGTEGQKYLMAADDRQELRDLMRDSAMIMKAPAFFHRLSKENQRGKDNPRRQSTLNKKTLAIKELLQSAEYSQAQAEQLALYLLPNPHVPDEKAAFKKAIQRQKRKMKS
jgi:hypothetical protein